jgi:hypothetical protein
VGRARGVALRERRRGTREGVLEAPLATDVEAAVSECAAESSVGPEEKRDATLLMVMSLQAACVNVHVSRTETEGN